LHQHETESNDGMMARERLKQAGLLCEICESCRSVAENGRQHTVHLCQAKKPAKLIQPQRSARGRSVWTKRISPMDKPLVNERKSKHYDAIPPQVLRTGAKTCRVGMMDAVMPLGKGLARAHHAAAAHRRDDTLAGSSLKGRRSVGLESQ